MYIHKTASNWHDRKYVQTSVIRIWNSTGILLYTVLGQTAYSIINSQTTTMPSLMFRDGYIVLSAQVIIITREPILGDQLYLPSWHVCVPSCISVFSTINVVKWYSQWHPASFIGALRKKTSLKLYTKSKHWRKCIWKCRLNNVGHFSGLNMLKKSM